MFSKEGWGYTTQQYKMVLCLLFIHFDMQLITTAVISVDYIILEAQ